MNKRRMPTIELTRIIGCFHVIGLHTITWYTNKNGLLENSLFIRCFLTDGVPLFWYIMGYFLFVNPNATLTYRLKKAVSTLLLPAFAVMVFSQIWQDWILSDIGGVSFLSCLDFHSFSFYNLFGNILRWSSDMTFGGHFWYIFSYVQVLLWTPLLQFVCVDEPKANRCRYYLIGLALLYIVNRDISNITVISINGNTYPVTVYSVITPTLLYILIGYETYLHRSWIQKHSSKLLYLGIGGFLLFNLLKYFLAVQFMRIDPSDSYFLNIGSGLAYLASYCLFIAIYCINIHENSRLEKVILAISSKTLGIYLIHGCVYRKMQAVGIRSFIYTPYQNHPNNILIEAFCTFLYALIVFVTCYALVLLLNFLKVMCFRKCLKQKSK